MTMRLGLKKKDLLLICIVLCVAGIWSGIRYFTGSRDPGYVTVKVDGVLEGTYLLDEDQVIEINHGTNILEIQDGKARMIEADCPDQLCVHQKAITAGGESIICLPNKVVAEVVSQTKSEYDAVTD